MLSASQGKWRLFALFLALNSQRVPARDRHSRVAVHAVDIHSVRSPVFHRHSTEHLEY
jgi:hypothetical protein